MRLCLIICAVVLVACGRDLPAPTDPLRTLDLEPCAGWGGAAPETERDLMRAALAEKTGRLCANAKLESAKLATRGVVE